MSKIKNAVVGLDRKMDLIEAKQNYTRTAVDYLCKFIEQGGEKLPEQVKSEINSTKGDSISEMLRLVFDDSKKMPTEISTSNICFSLDHPKVAGASHTQGKR